MKVSFLVTVFLLATVISHSQKAVGYVKVEGNDSTVNLRVISEADAISKGHGVFSITLPGGTVGAAELVPVSDPGASEVRIQMPQGTKAWKKETYFANAMGGVEWDIASSLVQSPDGGFAMCGETESFGAGGSDFMLVKMDGDGNFGWGKAYGYPSFNEGKAICLTHAGGYYLTGTAWNPTYGSYYAYVYLLDASGNIQLEGGYGTTGGDEYGEDCIQASDNDFVIIGRTDGLGAGGYDVYVKKTEYGTGNNIWGWALGGTENDRGYGIIQRSDGGYVAVGDTYNGSDWDIYFLYLDSGGDVELSLAIGGDGYDYGRDVVETYDGGYVVAGYSTSGGAGGLDAYLRKEDAAGNPIWGTYYGGINNEYCHAIIETEDHGLVFAGSTQSFGAYAGDFWIVKVDENGNGKWAWVFGTNASETAYDIIEADDGCLYVCGETTNVIDSYDAIIIKFAGDGSACMGSRLGFSGGGADNWTEPEGFRARRIELFSQVQANNDIKPIKTESLPVKGGLIQINKGQRDVTNFTPTVVNICN